jgi:hypothetical protein
MNVCSNLSGGLRGGFDEESIGISLVRVLVHLLHDDIVCGNSRPMMDKRFVEGHGMVVDRLLL